MLSKEEVIEVAKQVFDPEIPVNIWDLGLIYDIELDPQTDSVEIRMSLTAQNCPAANSLPQALRNKLLQTEKFKEVEVELVFEPKWTPERISDEGRKKLGIGTEGPAI